VKSSEFYWRSRACPLAYIEGSEEETEKAPGNNRKFRRFYFMVPRLGSFPYRRPLQQPCRCIGSVWVTSRAKKCHRLEHCSRSRDIVNMLARQFSVFCSWSTSTPSAVMAARVYSLDLLYGNTLRQLAFSC